MTAEEIRAKAQAVVGHYPESPSPNCKHLPNPNCSRCRIVEDMVSFAQLCIEEISGTLRLEKEAHEKTKAELNKTWYDSSGEHGLSAWRRPTAEAYARVCTLYHKAEARLKVYETPTDDQDLQWALGLANMCARVVSGEVGVWVGEGAISRDGHKRLDILAQAIHGLRKRLEAYEKEDREKFIRGSK